MSQQNDSVGFVSALATDVLPSNCTPDHLEIFSAPAVEVVRQWWIESNRRWAERDRAKAVLVHPGIAQVGQPVSVESNTE